MTPGQFQTLAIAWMAVLSVLIPVLFALVRLALSEWRALHTVATTAMVRTDSLDKQINGAMTLRIEQGAKAAIAEDKVKQ